MTHVLCVYVVCVRMCRCTRTHALYTHYTHYTYYTRYTYYTHTHTDYKKLNVNGGEIFATSEDEVMYAAIDSLVDKLDRQVIKHKEKLIRH